MRKLESGEIVIISLILLPLLFSMLVGIIDLARWHHLQSKCQHYLDEAATESLKLLPDEQLIKKLVEYKMQWAHKSLKKFNINVNKKQNGVLILKASGLFKPSFAGFIEQISNRKPIFFQVSGESQATSRPLDLVLIFSNGKELVPGIDPTNNMGKPWGTMSKWPASLYFERVKIDNTQLNPEWMSDYPRWATQTCFNPLFTSIKKAAISIYKLTANFPNSRVALISTPGKGQSNNKFSLLRSISKTSSIPGGYINIEKNRPRSLWKNPIQEKWKTGGDLCALIANSKSAGESLYSRTMDSTSNAHLDDNCPESMLFIPGQDHHPYNSLLPCYINANLSVEEAIYWQPSNLNTPTSLTGALSQALVQLSGSPLDEASKDRENRAATVNRIVVVVAGKLPPIEERNPLQITRLYSSGAKIILLSVDSSYGNNDEENFSNWEKMASVHKNLHLFRASSEREFTETLTLAVSALVRSSLIVK